MEKVQTRTEACKEEQGELKPWTSGRPTAGKGMSIEEKRQDTGVRGGIDMVMLCSVRAEQREIEGKRGKTPHVGGANVNTSPGTVDRDSI